MSISIRDYTAPHEFREVLEETDQKNGQSSRRHDPTRHNDIPVITKQDIDRQHKIVPRATSRMKRRIGINAEAALARNQDSRLIDITGVRPTLRCHPLPVSHDLRHVLCRTASLTQRNMPCRRVNCKASRAVTLIVTATSRRRKFVRRKLSRAGRELSRTLSPEMSITWTTWAPNSWVKRPRR